MIRTELTSSQGHKQALRSHGDQQRPRTPGPSSPRQDWLRGRQHLRPELLAALASLDPTTAPIGPGDRRAAAAEHALEGLAGHVWRILQCSAQGRCREGRKCALCSFGALNCLFLFFAVFFPFHFFVFIAILCSFFPLQLYIAVQFFGMDVIIFKF